MGSIHQYGTYEHTGRYIAEVQRSTTLLVLPNHVPHAPTLTSQPARERRGGQRTNAGLQRLSRGRSTHATPTWTNTGHAGNLTFTTVHRPIRHEVPGSLHHADHDHTARALTALSPLNARGPSRARRTPCRFSSGPHHAHCQPNQAKGDHP